MVGTQSVHFFPLFVHLLIHSDNVSSKVSNYGQTQLWEKRTNKGATWRCPIFPLLTLRTVSMQLLLSNINNHDAFCMHYHLNCTGISRFVWFGWGDFVLFYFGNRPG